MAIGREVPVRAEPEYDFFKIRHVVVLLLRIIAGIGKTAVVSVAVIAGVLILFISGLAIYASIDKEDTFCLRAAEFEDVNYWDHVESLSGEARRKAAPVYAHRLKQGMGTIFAYRFYSNGDLGTIDDEGYRKITLWIAGSLPTSPVEIQLGDNSTAVLLFSRGGSAWPEAECSGQGTSGTVKVEPISGRFLISIRADLTPAGISGEREWCQPVRLEIAFKAREMVFENLTSWLGIAGSHPYDETYR